MVSSSFRVGVSEKQKHKIIIIIMIKHTIVGLHKRKRKKYQRIDTETYIVLVWGEKEMSKG